METFGRGCLYIVLGIVVLLILAVIFRTTIHISWFLAIILIILAFWAASRKSRK